MKCHTTKKEFWRLKEQLTRLTLSVTCYVHMSSAFSSHGSTQLQDNYQCDWKSESVMDWSSPSSSRFLPWLPLQVSYSVKLAMLETNCIQQKISCSYLEKHTKPQIRQKRTSGNWRVKWCKMDKEMQSSWQVSQAEILSSKKVREHVKSSIWNSKKILQLPDVSHNQWVILHLNT